MTNRIVLFIFGLGFLFGIARAGTEWQQEESKNFVVIFRSGQVTMVPYILHSAEAALTRLSSIFHYIPSEKIIIRTSDFSDYGSAGATTLPHNFIRLEIEPLELGYENLPFDERIKWLISHELVHVVVNDLASGTEAVSRSLFSKVPPEPEQPLSIFYSLLTNSSRYTPRWHQEGIAVFMETWLNGGYGRLLGNFDEMYFRSYVLESRRFPTSNELDGEMSKTSFLLDMAQYLYGTRFLSYLAETYGTRKLVYWYRARSGTFLGSFKSTFEAIFGVDFARAWKNFVTSERDFQRGNIERLTQVPRSPIFRLQSQALGWVTQPYVDRSDGSILFGYHRAHHLTSIERYSLKNNRFQSIGNLPAPSLIQVASTAYAQTTSSFFFTTKNNQLYRDIWMLDIRTRHKRKLFPNSRIGNLAVSPSNGELWGVRHVAGKISLVYSPAPYQEVIFVAQFELGDILQHLAVSPSGKYLAATLHQASGRQAVIVADIDVLKHDGKLSFKVISEEGSPEFPSWSADEKYLYWNAFTNGVSNVYRVERENASIEAISHTLRGLFRPVAISPEHVFAFEFSTDGFIPVIIPNKAVRRLPAVAYKGQRVADRDPGVTRWALKGLDGIGLSESNGVAARKYSGLSSLKIQSFFPIVSGFKNQQVIGIYAHLGDPLNTHDLVVETGYSPFSIDAGAPRDHLKATYKYKRKFTLGVEHNASSFYDLVNDRKSGLIGTIWSAEQTKYWRFENPNKIKQTSSLLYYTGIQSINDNLVKVTFDDFVMAKTAINVKAVRRAIGSVDSEFGNDLTFTLTGFGVNLSDVQTVGGGHVEWSHFLTWAWPHNVLHFKLTSGYRYTKSALAIGKFYLGGFGNRGLDHESAKQFRNAFRFPGVPIYSLPTSRFTKMMVEHNLPPARFSHIGIGPHRLSHVDASWYSQALLKNGPGANAWVDLGAQINFVFQHWGNLETTFSAGFANAWNKTSSMQEWFFSLKLLRN